ncbi:MAG: hypothetical protein LLF75_08330 [Eubacteriales bacterium]|nr:hypothetical protein [Eubacteriales bacterium]
MSNMLEAFAPSGARILTLSPLEAITRFARRAQARFVAEPIHKRRTNFSEEYMKPDPHNFIASPAQGSALNAGQFGSIFAPHPCSGCAKQHQAYDALVPSRPQRNIRQAIAQLLRKPQ